MNNGGQTDIPLIMGMRQYMHRFPMWKLLTEYLSPSVGLNTIMDFIFF